MNRGYPDDDGSRTASGQHDEGRQRVSIVDVDAATAPARLAEMYDPMAGSSRINDPVDLNGARVRAKSRLPVDGNANATGRYDVAAENPAGIPGSTV